MPKRALISTEEEDSQTSNPVASGYLAMRAALIVDEEGSARRDLERGFRALGVSTHAVADLREAHDLAIVHAPDLTVIELGPVAGPGLALVEKLRRRLPGARFVITTSYGSVASAVRAMRCGVDHYLCKPVTAALILEALGAVDVEVVAGVGEAQVMTLDQAIWEYLHHTVEMTGSVAQAARRLGLWRQSLRRMLNKYRPPDGALANGNAQQR
jgi:ActR/RegA family two-component response regulator